MLAVTLALAAVLSGCSAQAEEQAATPQSADQAAALDALVENARPTLEALLASSPMYSDIQINAVPPSTMEYVYVYKDVMVADTAKSYLDSMVPTFQAAVDSQVIPAMISGGVDSSPRVTYTYQDPDGSILWSHTFDPS